MGLMDCLASSLLSSITLIPYFFMVVMMQETCGDFDIPIPILTYLGCLPSY
jgi:hypothetical protein